MSGSPPPTPKPEAERILDEMLDDLSDFFEGDFREEVREFVVDAFTAHPVGRLIAERVNERPAPDKSGEQGDLPSAGEAEKASGEK